MDTTQPDPIPHLIAAVTELSYALRDLDSVRPATTTRRADIAQDGEEYADEISVLLTLILQRLRGKGTDSSV